MMPCLTKPCHMPSPWCPQELHAEAGGEGPPLLNKENAERALMARLRWLPLLPAALGWAWMASCIVDGALAS